MTHPHPYDWPADTPAELRAIDAAVAERYFGYRLIKYDGMAVYFNPEAANRKLKDPNYDCEDITGQSFFPCVDLRVPHYTLDMNAAMSILEQLPEGSDIRTHNQLGRSEAWVTVYLPNGVGQTRWAKHPNAATAICLASLKIPPQEPSP